MDKRDCALCRRRRDLFSCANCTSVMLQQRRTMLAALQADVAVLRKKTEFALSTKTALVNAELRLDKCMGKIEQLSKRVMTTREELCSERIAVVERTSGLEERTCQIEEARQNLHRERERAENLYSPVLECLDYQVQWADENAAKVRGDRLRELFALFALTPEEAKREERENDEALTELPGLPLPVSGKYGSVPPEVVAAALGKVIHLLHCLIKYLKITYPHPMEFTGSFSTIGNTREGSGCHTLYPDGSVGFERGVCMLHENVAFLYTCQGVSKSDIHPTDLLGNLLQVYKSPRLGTLCDQVAFGASKSPHENSVAESVLLENSLSLGGSLEILPHYTHGKAL